MHERKKGLQSETPLLEIKPLSSSARAQLSVRKDTKPSVTGESAPFYGLNVHRGYVKLWRKLEDSAIFRDSAAYHVFTYLLIKAQYQSEKYSCTFEGKQIYLNKGEWVTGRNILAKAIGLPPSTVRNALKRLESIYNIIATKKDSKGTIVTLLNWDTYQNDEKKEDSDRTARGQQEDTNQEGKKVKNEKNKEKDSERPKAQLSDEEFINALKENPAYRGIDVDRELSRMDAWFLTPKGRGRQKTRRFIVNWLNKCDGQVIQENKKPYMTKPQESTITKMKEFYEKGNDDKRTRPAVKGISFQGI